MYLFSPLVNTSFISQRLKCMSSKNVKPLSSTLKWGFPSYLACTQIWHFKSLTMSTLGIKHKVDSIEMLWKLRARVWLWGHESGAVLFHFFWMERGSAICLGMFWIWKVEPFYFTFGFRIELFYSSGPNIDILSNTLWKPLTHILMYVNVEEVPTNGMRPNMSASRSHACLLLACPNYVPTKGGCSHIILLFDPQHGCALPFSCFSGSDGFQI